MKYASQIWREQTKKRIIESMGGKCVVCNYNKHPNVLTLHHLDPKEKTFSFGAIRANPTNWNTIVNELRKCVLLCMNCHAEYHAGIIEIPKNATRFNEKYSKYEIEKTTELTPCLICGKNKPIYNKTCSKQCAAKIRSKIKLKNHELKELQKTMSNVEIAIYLGVTETAIRKRLKNAQLV